MSTSNRLLEDQLCFALYSASRAFTKLYRESLKKFQLTYPQYIALLALWEEDGLSVSTLGDKLNLDSGTLTPMLKRMESQGLLDRLRSSEDERHVTIHLTDKAKKIRPEVLREVEGCLDRLDFLGDDYNHLLKGIKDITNQLEGISNEKTL